MFEIKENGRIVTVTETYIREFDIGDIVKSDTETYRIINYRFAKYHGGIVFGFEYLLEQIDGIRECPTGWTYLNNNFKKTNT